jgi:hypothetical protein
MTDKQEQDTALWGSIKPLEWVGTEGGPGKDIYAEPSGYVHYTVRHLRDGLFDVILHTDTGSIWFRQEKTPAEHSTYEDAKAFAEADHRKRVGAHLIALTTS